MKSFLTVFLSILSLLLFAQNELYINPEAAFVPKHNYFNTACFQVNQLAYIDISGAVANSPVKFYSNITGGKMLKCQQLDANGNLNTTFRATAIPSFVLNAKELLPEMHRGSGFVQYFNKKEFILNNITSTINNNKVNISFNSLRDKDKLVSYKLSGIDEVGTEYDLKYFEPNNNETWEDMSFEVAAKTRHQFVLTAMVNNEVRYSQVVPIETENLYNVYPIPANNEIKVDFINTQSKQYQYNIVDINGKVLQTGSLTNQFNDIDITSLAKGSYILKTYIEQQEIQMNRFIKQ